MVITEYRNKLKYPPTQLSVQAILQKEIRTFLSYTIVLCVCKSEEHSLVFFLLSSTYSVMFSSNGLDGLTALTDSLITSISNR